MRRVRIKPLLLILGSALLVLGALWAAKAVSWEGVASEHAGIGTAAGAYRVDWSRLFVGASALVVGVLDLVYAFRYPDK